MKPVTRALVGLLVCLFMFSIVAKIANSQFSQAPDTIASVPVATQWTLEAVTAPQKTAVKSVFLIECRKAGRKGTAFLLKSGIIVTNFHVVDGCSVADLWARSSMGQELSFVRMETDDKRDLAILRANKHMEGGFELGGETDPSPEARVKTWGYPLSYEGVSPILSMGYVAGYIPKQVGDLTVKHLIVNGAFNPGNSGGPLISELNNHVVGIVVTKWTLFSPLVETAIKGFKDPNAGGIGGRFSKTLPDGTQRSITDEEVMGDVLQEFYTQVQVMIGEAISVSELKAFLREKESSLDRK